MPINPMKILQLKSGWDRFKENHPRFVPFMKAAAREVNTDAVIEIALVTPEGKRLETNLKIKPEDMELIRQAAEIASEK